MKVAYESADYSDALIKKGLLEQAGFFVHMDNAGLGSVMPNMSLVLGHRLWVADTDLEQALRLLGDETLADEIASTDEPIDTCPECGSWKVTRHRSLIWLPFFFIIDLLMAPVGGRKRRCDNCGAVFEGETPELTLPMKLLFGLAVAYLVILAVIYVS